MIDLKDYTGEVRQIVIKGNGREKTTFLITNDLDTPVELIVGITPAGGGWKRHCRRRQVLLAQCLILSDTDEGSLRCGHDYDCRFTVQHANLTNFGDSRVADTPKIFRNFVRGKANITIDAENLTVTYPRKAHNPS